MEYIGKINLYEADKMRFANETGKNVQDRYGVRQGKKGLVCASCNGEYKSKGIAAVHGDNMLELIYLCECGNVMVSRSYGVCSSR